MASNSFPKSMINDGIIRVAASGAASGDQFGERGIEGGDDAGITGGGYKLPSVSAAIDKNLPAGSTGKK